MIPKTVVFAPIPRTRAKKATSENAGYLKSIRIAKRRSLIINFTRSGEQRLDRHVKRGGPGSRMQKRLRQTEALRLRDKYGDRFLWLRTRHSVTRAKAPRLRPDRLPIRSTANA